VFYFFGMNQTWVVLNFVLQRKSPCSLQTWMNVWVSKTSKSASILCLCSDLMALRFLPKFSGLRLRFTDFWDSLRLNFKNLQKYLYIISCFLYIFSLGTDGEGGQLIPPTATPSLSKEPSPAPESTCSDPIQSPTSPEKSG
jgi:hypothetical protein